ncbi:MAG: SU10 major capsid protein [Schleiferiaceae bacterium]
MAKAASYNTAGNRESLLDVITILEPESTPLTSMANKLNATGTFNEVQVDDLSTATFDGVNEGEDVTSFDNKAVNRARIGNYVQKFRRTYAVSDIQEIVDTAGVASEFANAESKAIRETKRDMEAAFCSSQDRQADSGTGSPYKTRGMFKFLGVGGQPSDIPAFAQNVANDTSATQTEATFNSVLQELYEANGMPGGQLTLIAGPTLKKEISDFSRQAGGAGFAFQVTQPAESKKITLTVNLYEGDFGTVAIVPSTLLLRTSGSATIDGDAGLLIDPEYVAIHTLKAESNSELENQGGGRRGYCDVIAGLAVMSPKAHGYFN